MLNIKKISILLFLLAQMSVTFAGNPADTTVTAYAGHWLVRLANDEVKTVKIVKLPTEVQFEGTEDFNEPMIKALMGITKLETFEGEKVVSTSIAMIPVAQENEMTCTSSFQQWCVTPLQACGYNSGGNKCFGGNFQLCTAPNYGVGSTIPCMWCVRRFVDGAWRWYPFTLLCYE